MALFDKPLFTFEMANNHQGSVEHGKRIIREMKRVAQPYEDCFDFAFKFQYRDLDTFIHPAFRDRMDMKNIKRFQDTRLSQEQFLELKAEVERQGMYTMCTAFDEVSAGRIQEQGYDILKVASCSFTDWPLLEAVAQTGMPVIVSGAGSALEDVDRVVAFFRNRGIPFSLMHCVAQYPTADEYQEMNQIDFYRRRYPGVRVGFSTHESPDNLEPVKVAVAKGAEIFEKHVGVPTDTITLNGYSANPEQVTAWLEAAKRTFVLCGTTQGRCVPAQKEISDLQALRRGVFAKCGLVPGQRITRDDYYLAFPCQEGQLLANALSKYAALWVGEQPVSADAPFMLDNVTIRDSRAQVEGIVKQILDMIQKSHVVIPEGSRCDISHHYGLDRFAEVGVTMIECVNREYCKKVLIELPGQAHPAHYHVQKEETFLVLYGSLDVVCDGVKRHVTRGETVVVERNVNHSFSSEEGCVFEEISTTHYGNDSFYEDSDSFIRPRKTRVYLTEDLLKQMEGKKCH